MQAIKTSALLFAASFFAASGNLAASQNKAPSNFPAVLFVKTAKKLYLDAGRRFTSGCLFLGSPQKNCGPSFERSVSEAMDRGQE